MAAAAEICDGMSKGRSGGLNDIEQWISTVEAPRLVIVDTLAQFRKAPNGKAQVYTEDYGAIAELQKLASKHSLGIVIVHHDRKMDADDVFDTVSGSLGLTGAADTILVMKRQASAVTLHVRGRDIEDAEKALQFDKPSCRWTILGEAAEVFRSGSEIASSPLWRRLARSCRSPRSWRPLASRAEARQTCCWAGWSAMVCCGRSAGGDMS